MVQKSKLRKFCIDSLREEIVSRNVVPDFTSQLEANPLSIMKPSIHPHLVGQIGTAVALKIFRDFYHCAEVEQVKEEDMGFVDGAEPNIRKKTLNLIMLDGRRAILRTSTLSTNIYNVHNLRGLNVVDLLIVLGFWVEQKDVHLYLIPYGEIVSRWDNIGTRQHRDVSGVKAFSFRPLETRTDRCSSKYEFLDRWECGDGVPPPITSPTSPPSSTMERMRMRVQQRGDSQ